MRVKLVEFSLLVLVLGASGCDHQDQSFSAFVRDVFDNPETSKPVSTIEGIDFVFTPFDELENYNDLLHR